MNKFLESIYFANKLYYHGNSEKDGKLRLGDKAYEGKGLYITTSPQYALAYTLVGKYYSYPRKKGFIYTIKIKKPLDIFNASNEEDVKRLEPYIPLNSEDVDFLVNKDWWDFCKRKPEEFQKGRYYDNWDRDSLITFIKDAGFDGYYNNEDWKYTVKRKNGMTHYHAIGSGLYIFDTSNLEIIKETDNETFMRENGITFDDIFKGKEDINWEPWKPVAD